MQSQATEISPPTLGIKGKGQSMVGANQRVTRENQPSPLPGMMQKKHKRGLGAISVFVLLAATAAFLSMVSGHIDTDLAQIWYLLTAQTLTPEQQLQQYVLLELRAPRIVMAIMVGALLATAGCALQGLVKNPLADPGIIGITSGASVAAAAVFIFGGSLQAWAITQAAGLGSGPVTAIVSFAMSNLIIFAAFIGALITLYFVMALARYEQGIDVITIILAGIAINALGATFIGIMSYIADDDALRLITYWTMGSLGGITWEKSKLVLAFGVIAIALFLRWSAALNMLSLGESHARAMGLDVDRYSRKLLWLVALSVALAVAMCGVIGFVGLVVPHIGRMLVGANHKLLMPVSAILGAFLMVFADLLSRSLVYPLEIPIGIVTSAIGAPFFIYLIYQQKVKGR